MQIYHANIVYSKDRDELAVFRDSYIAVEEGTVVSIRRCPKNMPVRR